MNHTTSLSIKRQNYFLLTVFMIGSLPLLSGQSSVQFEYLKGHGYAPVTSTSSGTLTRNTNYVQILANADFQAWNYNGEPEKNTQHHWQWGLFGETDDSHYFVADLDFPIGAQILQIAMYGLDLDESRSLRFRLYQQVRADGSLILLFEDFSLNSGEISGSDQSSEIMSVDLPKTIRLDNSHSTYFIEIAPVFEQDRQATTGSPWPGIGLQLRNVMLTYRHT